MKSAQAIRELKAAGFSEIRNGRGSHLILQNGAHRIVISKGTEELSIGMAGKVRSALRKSQTRR